MRLNNICRGQSLSIAFGITVLIVLLSAGNAGATLVTVSDRQILVEGTPFIIEGAGYSAVPIGIDPETISPYGDYFTSNYAAIYNRDLPLLRQMGANTIRLWGWNNAANHTDFLNKAYNNGTDPIYVIVTFWMGPSVYPDISSPSARAKIKADFRNMVATHKNNPAVLMWAIGNELNGPWLYGNNPTDLFSLINEMAQEAHLEEGANYHPVTAPLADVNLINTIAAYDSNMTNLDVWSVQLYRGPSFGSFFNDYANVSGKPLVITEYGIDAYDDKNGDEYEKIGIPYQAKYAESLWNEIMANSNVSAGGSIMAYSDEWWKGKYGQARQGCPDNNPSFHSNCGYPTGSHPDGYSNEEWWGIMRTKDNGSYPDIMEPRVVYYTLQSLWTKTLGAPAITGFAPESLVNDIEGATRAFNITVNQTVNIAWFINGTPVQSSNGVISASYTNTSAAVGTWNVTAVASNNNGTDSQTWVWNVTAPSVAGTPVITSWSNNKTNDATLNIAANVSETIRFNATANQSIDTWNWFLNNVNQKNNFDNFNNHFADPGNYIIKVNVSNAKGTSNTVVWNVNVIGVTPPTGVPKITSFSPATSTVTNNVGESRTFNITVNQTVNIAWFINGTPVQTNNGVTSATYTNTSASLGTWNVTAVASNSNGSVMQSWDWNVISAIPKVIFSTDKNTYTHGELVTFTIINDGTATIYLSNSAPWWVENAKTGERVFTPAALDVITPLDPGQSKSWNWNQDNDEGKQVPPGTYRGGIRSSVGENYTQEFEILPVPTSAGGSISGFKIKDLNKNEKWDAGEVGLPDWEIELRGIGVETRHIKMVTFTDATGAYRFDDLPAGKYLIKENLKKGFIPTSKPVIIIKLAKGEDSGNNNFTNRPISSLIK